MAAFEIRSAGDFLRKLIEEEADLASSGYLSERHALNAIMTAYHLHEWVWGDFAKTRYDLHAKWNLSPRNKASFENYLFDRCPAFQDARKITNGTKHFGVTLTGRHEGGFSSDFTRDFDTSCLWIERDGSREDVEDFVGALRAFWIGFFEENEISKAETITNNTRP